MKNPQKWLSIELLTFLKDAFHLTAPFCHQGINVHQTGKQLMWLAESRFVTIECYQYGSLQRFIRKDAFAARHKRFVHILIENGMVDFATFLHVHEAVFAGTALVLRLE